MRRIKTVFGAGMAVISIAVVLNLAENHYIPENDETGTTIQIEEDIDCVQKNSENVFDRNISQYLKKELVWEMAVNDYPKPKDFFMEDLPESVASQITYVNQIEETFWKQRGKYVVMLEYAGQTFEGHIFIKDTTPPVITAPERVEYDVNAIISYKSCVMVEDNSGEILKIDVDAGEVKSNIPGDYTVYFSAADNAGNVGRTQMAVTIKEKHIPTEEEIIELANQILTEIITNDMTKFQKAKAIFDWCRENIRYSADSEKGNILIGAYDGLHYHIGDCYTYFATASCLMDICGIDNLPVTQKMEHAVHYWSLVNTGNGWYHFDCSPNPSGFVCFMQTDEQIREYISKRENKGPTYLFDETDMPERATQVVFE